MAEYEMSGLELVDMLTMRSSVRVPTPLANCTYVVIKPEPSLPLRYGRKNRFSAQNNHDTEFSKL